MNKKILGGRGHLGIINNLRRQIIYLINWELNTSKNEKLILKLLRLLIISVGSEHYRSITAIEIFQCLDNVMKIFINKKTQSSWELLLNNIGKHNIILRDYILYYTLNVLKNEDNNETLQNLEAKSIHWKLCNNFLYLLYNLILKNNIINEDINKCINICFKENIIPPKPLIELFFKKNNLKDLIINNNLIISINIIIFIIDKLLIMNDLTEEEINDYIELLISYKIDILKRIFPYIINNCFNNNTYKAMNNIINIRVINNNNNDNDFFHDIKLKSIILNIESSPWNINNWYIFIDLIKELILLFSDIFLIDKCFLLKELFNNINNEFNLNNNLNKYIKLDIIINSLNELDISIILKNKVILKYIELLNLLFIKEDIFYRYFNLNNIKNILNEMQIIRFKIYCLLCVLNEIFEFIKLNLKDLNLFYNKDNMFNKEKFGEFFVDNNNNNNNNNINNISSQVLLLGTCISILLEDILKEDVNMDKLRRIIEKNIDDNDVIENYIYTINLWNKKKRK